MSTEHYLQRILKAYPEIWQLAPWKPRAPRDAEIDVESYVQ